MAAYQSALGGMPIRQNTGIARSTPGTIAALAVAYLNSPSFAAMAPSSKRTYRGIAHRFVRLYGSHGVATLRREHVERLLERRSATPAAGNNELKLLRRLMRLAIREGYRIDDPTTGVKPLKSRRGGFYTWTEDDIAAFATAHPLGSKARLALALLLHTGQRRSDIVKLGRQHVRDGIISVRQQKTGTLVEIPVHTELQASLDAAAGPDLTFLITAQGRPFTPAGFGNWFREQCRLAGLPKECSAHGIRKAVARRLAEAGCTPHQIMSITGHKTLKEVDRYTAQASRRRLALEAMDKVVNGTSIGKP